MIQKEEGFAFIADVLSPFSPGAVTELVALPCVFCLLNRKGQASRLRVENAATLHIRMWNVLFSFIFLVQAHLCICAEAKKKKIGGYEILTKELTQEVSDTWQRNLVFKLHRTPPLWSVTQLPHSFHLWPTGLWQNRASIPFIKRTHSHVEKPPEGSCH